MNKLDENFEDFILIGENFKVVNKDDVYSNELDEIIKKLSKDNFSFKNDQSIYNTPQKINALLSNRVITQLNENEKKELENKIGKIHILLAQNILKSNESFVWYLVPSYFKSKQTFVSFDDWIQKNTKSLESLDKKTLDEMEIVQINLMLNENNKTIESKTHFIAKNHLSNSDYLMKALEARDKHKMSESKPLEIEVFDKKEFESLPNMLSFFEKGQLKFDKSNFIHLFHLADQLESQGLIEKLLSEFYQNDLYRNFSKDEFEDILGILKNKLINDPNKNLQEFYNNIYFDYIDNFVINNDKENEKILEFFGEQSAMTYDDLLQKNIDFKNFPKMETLFEKFSPDFKKSLLEELKGRLDLYSIIRSDKTYYVQGTHDVRKFKFFLNYIIDKSVNKYRFESKQQKSDLIALLKDYLKLYTEKKADYNINHSEVIRLQKKVNEMINSFPIKEREILLKMVQNFDFLINTYCYPNIIEDEIQSILKSKTTPFIYNEYMLYTVNINYLDDQINKELPKHISKLEKELESIKDTKDA